MRYNLDKPLAAILAGVAAAGLAAAGIGTAHAAATAPAAPPALTLSLGKGTLVRLPTAMSDLFIADPKVADVQVRSSTMLYVFAKGAGETTVSATNKAGQIVWQSNVRVGANLGSVQQMLDLAMPDAQITATPMNGIVLLTGTAASPADVEDAQALVQAFVGEGTRVLSRLKSSTPLQVSLHVKIAEMSRDMVKTLGVNLLTRDLTGGFKLGLAQGRNFGSIGKFDTTGLPQLDASSLYGLPTGSLTLPFDTRTGQFITGGTSYDLTTLGQGAGRTNLGLAGKLLGLDIASAIDLAENDGLVTTLAEPNLTAMSGETASFLAGGEIPIPIAQALGTTSVEYKQYGVSLAFTPTVLGNGRISMRVRPEVSELSDAGAVRLNGFTVPALTTRRVETTVELGSGEAFVLGGLLQNNHNNSTDRAPGLGNLPVLGALFRSNTFRRRESELVIVVTPYLVRPTSPDQIKLPTDGYKAATDAQRWLLGKGFSGKSEAQRPGPTAAPPTTAPAGALPPRGGEAAPARVPGRKGIATPAAPGFSFD